MLRGARFSPCKTWRYSLTREWLTGEGKQLLLMLNPSDADALRDDSTTTLMVKRTQRDGFRRYEAANLFGLVDSDPAALYRHPDPIGPENDLAILSAIHDADRIIVAWGNNGHHLDRAKAVLRLLGERELWCFGVTKSGEPRFPRAIPRDLPLQPYSPLMFDAMETEGAGDGQEGRYEDRND